MSTWRSQFFIHIHPNGWPYNGLSPYNQWLIFTVFASIILQIIETEKNIYLAYTHYFSVFDIIIGLAFSVDYGLRLWIAGEYPQYRSLKGRLAYALSWVSMSDLLATAPFFLQFITAGLGSKDLAILRLLQVLKIFRAARLGRMDKALLAIQKAIRARSYEIMLSFILAGMMMLITATLLYWVERDVQPETFGSIPRALWWSMETLTTVGYGDTVPITPLGKLLAGFTAILGIGIIALPTGILAAAFSHALQHNNDNPPHPQEQNLEK